MNAHDFTKVDRPIRYQCLLLRQNKEEQFYTGFGGLKRRASSSPVLVRSEGAAVDQVQVHVPGSRLPEAL
jgi:hypothetical protein